MTPRYQLRAWRQAAMGKGALYRRMCARYGPQSGRALAALRDVQALALKIAALEDRRD